MIHISIQFQWVEATRPSQMLLMLPLFSEIKDLNLNSIMVETGEVTLPKLKGHSKLYENKTHSGINSENCLNNIIEF